MPTTLCIAFSLDRCHAALIEQNNQEIICQFATIIPHVFEEHDTLPTLCHSLKHLHLKKNRLIIALPHQKTMTQHFTLDKTLTDQDVMRFLKARAIQSFGHAHTTLCIDYEVMACDDADKKRISAVAAHRNSILSFERAFNDAKMSITAIDVDSFAIQRFHQCNTRLQFINQSDYRDTHVFNFDTCLGLSLWPST